MEIALKGIKHAEFASEETHCFSATVYIDGKRFCVVSNDGHGGCDDFDGIKGGLHGSELYARIKEIDAELGKEILQCDGFTIENSLEIEIGNRVNEWLKLREVKKVLRKICYAHDGGIYTIGAEWKPTPENIAKVKNCDWWKPDFVLLNGMAPEAAAVYF